MQIEIKRHEWKERGENHASPFFVWVGGEPRFDLSDCAKCRHYRGDDSCAMAVQVGDKGDDKLYPFCGKVCGYFDMPNAGGDFRRGSDVNSTALLGGEVNRG